MLSFWLFTGVCSLYASVLEQTVCSEMLAFKLQTPANPEESIRHSEHGKSLKSRILANFLGWPYIKSVY
jgi:hypothetical protein